ncbi:MAG: hypothetical protein IJU68_08135 [Bacteroidales bacterium]|nr:hypothetical protein [Bacteroidales bacterium]
MKKTFVRLMALVLGLNVFTACYGPALPPDDYMGPDAAELSDQTKASEDEDAESEEEVVDVVSES